MRERQRRTYLYRRRWRDKIYMKKEREQKSNGPKLSMETIKLQIKILRNIFQKTVKTMVRILNPYKVLK